MGPPPPDPWRQARTYENILRLGHQFVTGQINTTPWHCGPINPESVSAAGNFAQLHNRGVLTLDSQPPTSNQPEWKVYRHKSYLNGFMLTKHARALDPVLRRQGIVTYFYDHKTRRSFGDMNAYVKSHPEARVLTQKLEKKGNADDNPTRVYHNLPEQARGTLDFMEAGAAKRDMADRVCFFMLVNPVFGKSPRVETVLLREIKALDAKANANANANAKANAKKSKAS